jgi:excisionase family DNA binding protein
LSDPINPIEPRRKGRVKIAEMAKRLGCSLRYAYGLTYKGEIPSYAIASHRWVDEEDIEAYVARCRAAGPNFGRAPTKRPPGRPSKPRRRPEKAR